MQRFDEIRTDISRALQIWPILIGAAHNRQTVTYKILAHILGFGGPGVLGRMLGYIMFYCIQNHLPPLTILVVNQETGVPGDGLIDGDLHELREQVFGYPWYGLYPPTENEFEHARQTEGQG